jgi:hypothetical protein
LLLLRALLLHVLPLTHNATALVHACVHGKILSVLQLTVLLQQLLHHLEVWCC